MTVNELAKQINDYLEDHSGDEEVVICDDGADPKFFSVSFLIGTNVSKTVKPAKFEMRKVRYTPPGPKGDCSNIVMSNCIACKNFRGYSGRRLPLGQKCVKCEHDGKVLNDVIEYVNSQCCSFDPKDPIYVDMKVQVEPPEYKTERVLAFVTDLYNNEIN